MPQRYADSRKNEKASAEALALSGAYLSLLTAGLRFLNAIIEALNSAAVKSDLENQAPGSLISNAVPVGRSPFCHIAMSH